MNMTLSLQKCGGCVGDIESLPFIEAVRQVKWDVGPNNFLVINLTLIPYLKAAGRIKNQANPNMQLSNC